MTLRGYYRLAAETAKRRDRAVAHSTALYDAYDRWARFYGPLASLRFRPALCRASEVALTCMRTAQIARNEARFRMLFDREASAQAQCEAEARLREAS